MDRFIIVNVERGWIQGDIQGRGGPASALAAMLAGLTAPTDNETWAVHRAPAGFPDRAAGYACDDAGLVAMLAGLRPAAVLPNAARMAMAS